MSAWNGLARRTPLKRGRWIKRKTPLRSWDSHRTDPNDTLYSQIIRFGQTKCWMCGKERRRLEAAHIMGRAHHATRFMLTPVRNAIPLDGYCHRKIFDRRKMISLLRNPAKRVFTAEEESFSFLVAKCGYTWEQLEFLYREHTRPCKYGRLETLVVKRDLEAAMAALKAKAV